MCTVLLRLDPDGAWPVLLGAVRDEFVERRWDRPARHWSGPWATFVGGRDRAAGGTWLAVDPNPAAPAVAAVLNGGRRDPLPGGAVRPTRGELVLRALAGGSVPEGEALDAYDCFHLLLARAGRHDLWSWDGVDLLHRSLVPGHHIVVNTGLDAADDPLVPHFAPLLAAVAEPDPGTGDWGGWPHLLSGDGLAGDDDRSLVVDKLVEGRPYGSTSAALVGLGAGGRVRYDFTATPADPTSWRPVLPGAP
jgi:uncharacterized protein with NRDE domain